jgi:hypothetical protein
MVESGRGEPGLIKSSEELVQLVAALKRLGVTQFRIGDIIVEISSMNVTEKEADEDDEFAMFYSSG